MLVSGLHLPTSITSLQCGRIEGLDLFIYLFFLKLAISLLSFGGFFCFFLPLKLTLTVHKHCLPLTSIHLPCFRRDRLWWEQAKQSTPDVPLLCKVFYLLMGNPVVSPGQMRYVIPAVSSRIAQGCQPTWTCLENQKPNKSSSLLI